MIRRGNKEKLLEKILKQEARLLQEKKEDYFQDYYGSTKMEEKEVSDEGVSDYKSGDEEEEDDYFDEDFNMDDDSQEEDKNSEFFDKNKKPSFLIVKNKKDRYFKKGFDIKNLNYESLEFNVTQNKKIIKKKKNKYISVSDRAHFIHENFSQKELLNNALILERANIFNFLENEKISEKDGNSELLQKDIFSHNKSFHYKKKIFWDSFKNKISSKIEFASEQHFLDYFSITNNLAKNSEKKFSPKKDTKEEDSILYNDLKYLKKSLIPRKRKKYKIKNNEEDK
jgi:hypothetical protein